jgi:predicted metal-dependent peptidase
MNVRSEQVFDRSQISEITKLMKPRGGGFTRVGCVSDYIRQRNLTPDCLIVLTDGWVERDVQWDISTPTLWTVTENAGFRPPAGRVVKINN